MALPFIIGYLRIAADADPQTVLDEYTCPNDGYVRAWVDSTDPTLIWLIPSCPVDAVVASLKVNIGNFVNMRYNYSDKIADPHYRVLNIIAGVREDAVNWLNQNTTESIAAFLANQATLQQFIFTELHNQGAVS